MSDQALRDLGEYIDERLPNEVVGWNIAYGDINIEIVGEHITKILEFLRDDTQYNFKILIDICGADYPDRAKRFEVVYHLLSLMNNIRVRIKIKTNGGRPIQSAISVFPNANWYEREVFDMFGIEFKDHPDLRRILTDYGFEGHPLRKDFPLSGYVEVRYDDELQKVVYEPVNLPQEFRSFEFESPWEGMTVFGKNDDGSDEADAEEKGGQDGK